MTISELTIDRAIYTLLMDIKTGKFVMGSVVFWTIVRMAVVIPALWVLQAYTSGQYWWIICFAAIYGFVIHPAFYQYSKFEEDNKDVINSTLCSSCKNFDKTAVLCVKFDQHPTREKLPCDGLEWEPMLNDFDHEQKEYKQE